MGVSPKRQCLAFARGMQKSIGSRRTPAAARVDLIIAYPFRLTAIEVAAGRVAQSLSGFDKASAHRMRKRRNVSDMLRPAAPVMRAVPVEIFGLFEVRQDVVPAPAFIAHRLPVVKITRLTAHIDHGVDRARTADNLAARPITPPSSQRLNRFGIVHPVDPLIEKRAAVTNGHLNPDRPVASARFKQQHGIFAALGQPIGQHATRRASADNDIVKFLRH